MRPNVRNRSPFLIGLLLLLVVLAGTWFAFTKENPLADPFEVKAAFRTANDVKKKAPVRIAGVTIGKVTNVEALGKGRPGAMVTMAIDKAGLPLKADATFKVRPRIFLEGNFFVDVSPGTPNAPELGDNDTIPVNQTSGPVQFGQILAALNTDTREDLRRVLQEYGGAINSEGGRGYNRSIKHWRRAYRFSAEVNEATLGQKDGDLSGYIRESGKVAAALDRSPEQLKSLITDFAATADAFADEQGNLSATIDELPRTLRVGRSALRTLNAAFPNVRRFVADFRPAVRSSGPALDATLPFVRQLRALVSKPELRGLVRDLRPVVPNLTELNRGGVALQEQQRLLSSCGNEVVRPWQQDTVVDPSFPSSGKVFQEGVKWMPGIAGESRSFDANGQYVRSLAKTANVATPIPGGRFFLTDQPLQGSNPPIPAKGQPKFLPEVPCETQERPDLRSKPAAPPAGFRIDQGSPAALRRQTVAVDAARAWLADNLKMSGLDSRLKVSDEPLRANEVDDVIRGLGR